MRVGMRADQGRSLHEGGALFRTDSFRPDGGGGKKKARSHSDVSNRPLLFEAVVRIRI